MHKEPRIHRESRLAFATAVCLAVWVFSGAAPARSSALEAGSDSALPTLGGQPAFATKADAMVSTVEGFLDAGDYESAEKAAVELTRENPAYARGWMMLGYCLSRNGRFAESNDAYAKAIELGADVRNVRMRQAYNFLRLARHDDARRLYRELLVEDPEDAETMKQLAYVEGKLGHYDDAAYYYRRILDHDPDNRDVIAALAKIEAKRGGGSEVKALLERTLELDPDDVDALGKLGLLLIRQKDFEGAAAPLSRLVTIDPDDVKAHRNLGVVYYQLGKKSNARTEFERVRGLGGNMKGLYGPLVDCYLAAGASSQALALIKEGLSNGSQQAWLYSMWGKILERSHRYDAAIAKFAKAVALHEAPWSAYAKKQIVRQTQLKKRAAMISAQQGMK